MAVHVWQVIATLLPSYLTSRDHLLESAPLVTLLNKTIDRTNNRSNN